MKRSEPIPIVLLAVFLWGADSADLQDRLAQHRNLGKAFSENPTTQAQAVLEFKKALALAPNSNREKLNYGLALLRAGKTSAGVACLQEVQRNDPKLPHTWFNLGIYYKKTETRRKPSASLTHGDPGSGRTDITNEKFKGPPYPEFRLFSVTSRIKPG
jgi:predicted Zn-dependent protease